MENNLNIQAERKLYTPITAEEFKSSFPSWNLTVDQYMGNEVAYRFPHNIIRIIDCDMWLLFGNEIYAEKDTTNVIACHGIILKSTSLYHNYTLNILGSKCEIYYYPENKISRKMVWNINEIIEEHDYESYQKIAPMLKPHVGDTYILSQIRKQIYDKLYIEFED